ncbi:hypothetical protein N7540_001726 [Penicillium herquei]|nr:hypothetical protein N7540_001726 [Penicillium herquei]
MTSLCTSECSSSLAELATAVEADCDGTYNIDNQNWTLPGFMEYFQYKYGLICLADETTDDFCLDLEASWNITEMVILDEAVWPTYTNKCYFDVTDGFWTYVTDIDGTCLELFEFEFEDASPMASLDQMAAWDYYVEKSDPIDDDNYGWNETLEFDEYPLKFKYGLESTWGNVWEYASQEVYWENPANHTGSNITAQVWANMQLNCGWDNETIVPSNDYTAYENVTICAPLSCPITVIDVNTSTIHVTEWVDQYANFTLTQFLTWNPYIGLPVMANGDTVCSGPPSGVYVPSLATASATVFTTAASPTAPVPSGTDSNCGLYYTVQSGDDCALICEAYDLTFDQFQGTFKLSRYNLLKANKAQK